MPSFCIGDSGRITIRLQLPKGSTFDAGSTASIVMTGQRTGTIVTLPATISSNTSSLACADHVLAANDFSIVDAYEAQLQWTAPGGIAGYSVPPYPVWNVLAPL